MYTCNCITAIQWNKDPLKESEQDYKIWTGNEDRRKNKEAATISKTTKENKMNKNLTKWKDSNETTSDRSNASSAIAKSKDIGEKRKSQKIILQGQI